MIIRRETATGSNDLNVAFRPCTVDEMIGNETNRKIIKNALDSRKVPHTQLFTGDAGCGKTTMARIIALGLNCETNGIGSTPCLNKCQTCRTILEGNSIDIKEINVGQDGGKDAVKAIVRDLPMAPFNSRYKVIVFDEAHELTAAAKDLLLKPIEHGYDHVYFIFCTNQPEKLRSRKKDIGEAFLDRCSILNFGRVEIALISKLLLNVCEFEAFEYNTDVLSVIAEESKGVPRNALVWLNQIATEGSWTLEVANEICGLVSEEDDPQIKLICQKLNQGKFKEAVQASEKIKTMSVESIRIPMSYYFLACLKNSKRVGDAKKYSQILDIITQPVYEQGKAAIPKWYNMLFKISDIILSSPR